MPDSTSMASKTPSVPTFNSVCVFFVFKHFKVYIVSSVTKWFCTSANCCHENASFWGLLIYTKSIGSWAPLQTLARSSTLPGPLTIIWGSALDPSGDANGAPQRLPSLTYGNTGPFIPSKIQLPSSFFPTRTLDLNVHYLLNCTYRVRIIKSTKVSFHCDDCHIS